VVFLIITRVLQGVGAALLTPGSLAILEASFRPADRARAIGAWSGLGGIAIAAGPLVGGYLISAASWRWIFFINIPVAVMVIVLSARHVPESRSPDASGRTDYLGAAAMVVFLSGITFAFIEAPALGWSSPVVLIMASLGLIGLAVFLAWERRVASPMLPLSVFAQRQFAAVNAVSFIVYGALTGATLLLPVVLQVVSGYSPLGSGLALLPLTIIMLVLSGRSGQLAARIGPRLQLTAGPLVIGAGLALLTLGIASSVNNDVARFGGLLAVAILPALAGITGSAYLDPDALAAGFRTAVLISGALCAAGGLLAAVTITNPAREHRDAAISEPCLHCGLDAPPLAASTDRRILAIQPRG